MKKMTIISTAALGAILAVNAGINTVAAADVESKATIQAIAGTDPVAPVDPDQPEQPGTVDPEDGNETNQSGPLQINYVSHLKFGNDIKITSKTVKANAKNTNTPYFQVSDLRGTGAGWSLNVSLGDFKNTSGNKTIKGATISLINGEAVTSNETNENPAETKDVVLTAGETAAKPLMTAAAGNGRGTWVARYTNNTGTPENNKIVFEAPTNSIDANTQYEAVLTWQLSDRPDASN